MIKLSNRLQALFDWCDGEVIADIGCDHGYIPLKLVQEKKKKVYACDVAESPLERAKKLFEKEEANIDCLLMNGIIDLPNDVDQILIAGMGGQLMISILEEGKEKWGGINSMILSPHKDAPALRQYLIDHHFRIEKERTIKEGSHFYPILYVVHGEQERSASKDYYGYHMIEDEEYEQFLDHEYKKWKALESNVPPAEFKEGKKRLMLLEHIKTKRSG